MGQKQIEASFGVITYGLTPPKKTKTEEEILRLAAKQIERIKDLDIDGLVIYDIQDESSRTDEKRTFPFIETIDPALYANVYLKEVDIPKVVYRCVGNYVREDFINWLESGDNAYSVFVGTASRNDAVTMTLSEAYEQWDRVNKSETLKAPKIGGVVIPERHLEHRNEPERLARKVRQGCSFFISQCVYDTAVSRAFLKDYKAYFEKEGLELKPIIFTLTPCGSLKTLEFIHWLGIRVPEWVEKELLDSEDMLKTSLNLIGSFFVELALFAKKLGVPIGCNIETVSIKKREIEAASQLVKDIRGYLARHE